MCLALIIKLVRMVHFNTLYYSLHINLFPLSNEFEKNSTLIFSTGKIRYHAKPMLISVGEMGLL
jgi:hypothetical protein